jgi:predicted cytidylate kinase
MIIVFSGLHGTGKSTIARRVAEALHATYYSTGNAFRDLAKEKGLTLEEFSRMAEGNFAIDKELDQKILTLAKTGKDFVFDGQLPAYLLGDLVDFAILLQCETKVRIERMRLRDGRDFAAQEHETLMREESERQRFLQIYQIDMQDAALIARTYNYILDVTTLSIDEVFEKCLIAIKNALHLP